MDNRQIQQTAKYSSALLNWIQSLTVTVGTGPKKLSANSQRLKATKKNRIHVRFSDAKLSTLQKHFNQTKKL
jgi:hypothetical protein